MQNFQVSEICQSYIVIFSVWFSDNSVIDCISLYNFICLKITVQVWPAYLGTSTMLPTSRSVIPLCPLCVICPSNWFILFLILYCGLFYTFFCFYLLPVSSRILWFFSPDYYWLYSLLRSVLQLSLSAAVWFPENFWLFWYSLTTTVLITARATMQIPHIKISRIFFFIFTRLPLIFQKPWHL